ncbi:MAG: hypothetical protein AAF802_07200 [Planctomycetota bacterium]
MKILLGQILLWSGFLAASFVSVASLEDPDDKWRTIPWAWYAVAMAVGIAGVVLLRIARKEDHSDETKTDAEYSAVKSSLSKLSSGVDSLCESTQQVPAQVLNFIDSEIVEPFADFAEARQALVKRFGISVYADVMTEFASAERYVNRTWSAAADGYIDEVNASIRRAQNHLARVRVLLNEAEAQ